MPRPEGNERIDLTELGNAKRWDAMIVTAKGIMSTNAARFMTEYERTFVADMIHRDEDDRPLWSPTRKQYNMLRYITMGDVYD